MQKVVDFYVRPGICLVFPIKEGVEQAGMLMADKPVETSTGKILQGEVIDEFTGAVFASEGDVIIYSRMHAQSVEMYKEDGEVGEYAFVLPMDVKGKIVPGWGVKA